MNTASSFLTWSFAGLAILVAAALPVGLYAAGRRTGLPVRAATRTALAAAVGAALWLALTAGAAARGALTFTGTPPTMVVLIAAIIAIAILLGVSPVGSRLAAGLPLAVLVGVQGFRLPLELLMHRAYAEGLMPVQMSYSGLNFDIVTGASALIVAALVAVGRAGPGLVRVWNWLGSVLLLNIMVIANLSTPTPLRVFMNEPANVWVTQAPFVWLPSVFVLLALAGHIVIFRRLRGITSRAAPVSGRSGSHAMQA